VKVLAIVWVLALALLAVLVPRAAASTQRISIDFAVEGAGPGAGAATQIYDELGRSVGCHVPFTSAPTCSTSEIPNTQVTASASTITFVDHESPSTRCLRVHANDTDGPGSQPPTPTSVRATFTDPDGSQRTVGAFRMEDGAQIYVGSTPAEAALTPGGPPPTTGTCGGQTDGEPIAPQCSDGLDNDLDRRVDFPTDIGCTSQGDEDEDDDPCVAFGSGLTVKIGTPGRDILNGSAGLDDLRGLGGNDVLNGRGDGDCLYGGGGADRISGGPGGDDIDAGPGNDRVYGQRGKEEIDGGSGNDVLFGGPGNDALLGDLGNDRLVDHRGRDAFHGDFGRDRIDARDGGRDYVKCGNSRDRATDLAIVDRRDVVIYCEKVIRAR
jgi:Ca2+-binding RTX toxin-like protein